MNFLSLVPAKVYGIVALVILGLLAFTTYTYEAKKHAVEHYKVKVEKQLSKKVKRAEKAETSTRDLCADDPSCWMQHDGYERND